MAVRGTIAKQNVTAKIKEIFGADFITEINNKIYVWTQENGEKMQIAISLTCPKTPIDITGIPTPNFSGGLDFEHMDTIPVVAAAQTPVEISEEEKETIAELMRKLNL